MYSAPTPTAFLKHLTRAAKEESKATKPGYTYHLEQIARFSGFSPWRALTAAIESHLDADAPQYLNSEFCLRVLNGLEKALPSTIDQFAEREAERVIEDSGMCFAGSKAGSKDHNVVDLWTFLEAELPHAWSPELKRKTYDSLAVQGTRLTLEEIMFEY
ncbi:hypothetical protein [Marinobacter sp. HN1S83]|uniref:hypothetical protein n=1 Tax=Marinobacter sp. HN1S83 TaxID=3382301 RepID=UPI00387B6461